MNFGDQVRELRTQKGLTQGELAKQLGVSRRTVVSYELGTTYPRFREIYDKLAELLGVKVEDLRTEDEEFMTMVSEEFGGRAQKQAAAMKEQFSSLMAGGELSPEEKDAFMLDLQEIFVDAKREAKKFTPKKYKKEE